MEKVEVSCPVSVGLSVTESFVSQMVSWAPLYHRGQSKPEREYLYPASIPALGLPPVPPERPK